MAETEQSMVSMRAEATRLNGLMRVQKISLTKLVNKSLQLMETFKREQVQDSSPLVTQCATDVMKFHERTTDLLTRRDSNMNRYQELCVNTFTAGYEADINNKNGRKQ